jgi:hypothetical protein
MPLFPLSLSLSPYFPSYAFSTLLPLLSFSSCPSSLLLYVLLSISLPSITTAPPLPLLYLLFTISEVSPPDEIGPKGPESPPHTLDPTHSL